jgi:hypothetical protein
MRTEGKMVLDLSCSSRERWCRKRPRSILVDDALICTIRRGAAVHVLPNDEVGVTGFESRSCRPKGRIRP